MIFINLKAEIEVALLSIDVKGNTDELILLIANTLIARPDLVPIFFDGILTAEIHNNCIFTSGPSDSNSDPKG